MLNVKVANRLMLMGLIVLPFAASLCWAQTPNPPPFHFPLEAANWSLTACDIASSPVICGPSTIVPLSNNSAGALQFIFPDQSTSYTVNFLTIPYTARGTLSQNPGPYHYTVVEFTLGTSALGTQVSFLDPGYTCAHAPYVRAFIERQGDGGSNFLRYQWWSMDPLSYELDLLTEKLQLKIDFQFDLWENADGEIGKGFVATLDSPMAIGLAFGCETTGGVNTSGGEAQFTLDAMVLK
jgi:hypothetical protein